MEHYDQAPVTVTIGGKEHQLHFEFQDFARAEARLGVALTGPLAAPFWTGGQFHQLATLLYVGMIRERPTLTMDDVYKLPIGRDWNALHDAVMKAVEQQFPAKEAKPDAQEPSDAPFVASESGGTTCTQ